MVEKDGMPGGFQSLILAEDFDEQVLNAFEVVNSIVGVSYRPLAVQYQVVAGINYTFFCRAQPVVPNADAYMAKVSVFASLPDQERKIHYSITEIVRVNP